MPSQADLTIEIAIDTLEAKESLQGAQIGLEIETMRAAGMSRAAILAILASRREDLVNAMVNRATQQLETAISRMTVTNYWSEILGTSDYWLWQFEPSAKHCATCVERNGKVGTTAEMETAGIPGSGATDCRYWCRCALIPITKEEYDAGPKIS
jgi:hypothetical protein